MMTKAVAPVPPTTPVAAPCVAWDRGNKDECNCEEGNRRYPSHCYPHYVWKGRPPYKQVSNVA